MRYINYNGNIYSEHEHLLPVTNRAFRYGDGFFETMVMFDRKIPLLEFHWSRLQFTIEVLNGKLPSRFDEQKLFHMILDLASVNGAIKNARVRVQFFRKGDGLYLPETDEFGYSISMEKIENEKFESGNGLTVGIREDCFKAATLLSDLKHSSALPYVMAAQFAKHENWDDMILLNHFAQICESLNSNIFLVMKNKMVTPNIDSGCVNGVMRSYLMTELGEEIEEREVEEKELQEADEILLTNAVKGVQWVRTFQSRSYENKKAVELTAFLNKNLLEKLSS